MFYFFIFAPAKLESVFMRTALREFCKIFEIMDKRKHTAIENGRIACRSQGFRWDIFFDLSMKRSISGLGTFPEETKQK